MLAPRESPVQFRTLRRGVEGRVKFPDRVRKKQRLQPSLPATWRASAWNTAKGRREPAFGASKRTRNIVGVPRITREMDRGTATPATPVGDQTKEVTKTPPSTPLPGFVRS
eukprot:7792810-Heterocapsa_arctica.AAC.1